MRLKKNRGFIVLLLLLMLGVTTGGAYSYWAGTVHNPAAVSGQHAVQVGQGKPVETRLVISKDENGKKLVPQGRVASSVGGVEENTDSYVVNYTVAWKESGDANVIDAAAQIDRALTVVAVPKLLNAEGVAVQTNLVKVKIDNQALWVRADGESIQVPVIITLNEPKNEAEYQALAGAEIVVDLTFSVGN